MKKLVPSILATSFLMIGIGYSDNACAQGTDPAFNPYECTPQELVDYIKNRKEGLDKGTPLESWSNFREAYVASQQQQGNTECAPFWEESEDLQGIIDNVRSVADSVSDFLSDPGGALSNAANSAKDRLDDLLEAIADEITKGMCERLEQDPVTPALENQVSERTGMNLNLGSDEGLMRQIRDQTVCGREEYALGERLEYGYSGTTACAAFENDGRRSDRARSRLAEDAVDDVLFDEIDRQLWGD